MSDTDTLLHRVLLVLDVPPKYIEDKRCKAELSDPIQLADLLMRGRVFLVGPYDKKGTAAQEESIVRETELSLERHDVELAELQAMDKELTARIDALGAQHGALCNRVMNMAVEVGRLGQIAERCRECVWVDNQICQGDHK